MKKGTILLTGSQGFIGSYIAQDLLDNGYKVIGVDNYSKYGELARGHDNHPNFIFKRMDARELHTVKELNELNLDSIISCAGMIGGTGYFHKYAYDLLATNERIMASTFDLAISLFKKKRLKKIVVLSSSIVLESTKVYPTPEDEVFNNPPPTSTYGLQKLACEYFCQGAEEQYKLPYIIIRPFNTVGIGEETIILRKSFEKDLPVVSHVLPDLVYNAIVSGKDGTLPILGSGSQVRHYTHGKDVARAIRLAIENSKAINETFNISHPNPVSVMELAAMVWSEIYGTDKFKTKHLRPMIHDLELRSPDVSKAKKLLGFSAEISPKESVKEVVAWFKEQFKELQ